ncbi:AEC family transporter [Companilactobacillus sp.]|uniref:AEC family transporter n=1 Tax=Companilactobacillus sp. TaxID=2767905 RepID=UPI0025BD32F0|nr:AEC family transporter [Companilactobacillus sp.]MCH4008869.1 AEC family transporter [Companilactobacillus sp.]MCH4050952.1 AEC family transporter [Companilactobacillus sp.]MCH4076812.1 AEC family transporter [Companilactobacillus sp.]MCH4125387.1 AEC family transporter [Companilactobacillus sp.]MCH4131929.1 AEC family transporter [Companilactobacillus sp.]
MDIGQLSSQILLLFGLMLVGVIIGKLKFMQAQTSNDLTNILIYVVSPCLILNAFEQPYSPSRIKLFLLAFLGVVILYFLEIIISKLVFMRGKNANIQRISTYGSVYSNAGFMGIPLISALFGSTGVFYGVVSLAAFNLFNWTHGISLFSHHGEVDEPINWKKILLNPNFVAILIGLIMFLTSFKLPGTLNNVVKYVGSINTPLSMIVIGNSLTRIKFSREMLEKNLWLSLMLRNLIYPAIGIIILKLLGVTGTAFYTTVIMAACPVAGLVVLFTLQSENDPAPAISLMSLSTLLCLITIPIIFTLSNLSF